MSHGVIGSTTVFGIVSLGSSPSGATTSTLSKLYINLLRVFYLVFNRVIKELKSRSIENERTRHL